jgi:O-antigen/teichoic acid export membrane protein
MKDDARATVRNAVLVILQRALQTVGGLGFAVFVPRVMGPEDFGRYALATSVAFWLALVSGLGFTNIVTRYVPQLLARGDTARLSRLVGNLLTLRTASGLAAAALYLLIGLAWWRDFNGLALVLFAVAVWTQGLAGYVFSLFLGLNRAAHWAVADTVRRWLLLALVLPGYQWAGLRGAAAAVALTEMAVLALGLRLSLRLRGRADLRPDRGFLAPYIRFGLAFLAIQVLYAAFHGSGEVLVRAFSGAYAEIGYFSLAHGIYLIPAALLPQLMLAFAPQLTRLLETGRTAELHLWAERLGRTLAAGAVLGVFGACFLSAPYVPLLFGAAFAPVAPNLPPLAYAFVAVTLGSVPGLLTLVHERPGTSLVAAGLRLAVFWLLAPPLIVRWGSRGACLAILATVSIHALFLVWRTRDLLGHALRAWATPVALGAIFLPVLWLRRSEPTDAALFAAVVAGYTGGLLLFRIVTLAELIAMASLWPRRGVTTAEVPPA